MNKAKYSKRISEKISCSKEEREIIEYGLHQGFLSLLHLLTFVVFGILWKELIFVFLMFLGIFF